MDEPGSHIDTGRHKKFRAAGSRTIAGATPLPCLFKEIPYFYPAIPGSAGSTPKIPNRVGRIYRKAIGVGTKTTVMKKACLVLSILLTCFTFSGISQDIRVGVSAGLTISDVESPYNEMNHSVKTGYMAGLLLDVPLGDRFIFQPQLNYVQKGNLVREDANGKIYNALRYAEMPFNFIYKLNSGSTEFYLGAGPSVSVNVPSKRVTDPKEGERFYSDILFGETPENDFKGFDYGANFLAGIRFANKVFISGNYNMGLRDLNTKDGAESIKNKYFGIQVGFIFNN